MEDRVNFIPNLCTEERFLEDLQEAIVEEGGRFMRQSELKKLTVGELLSNIVSPNKIALSVGLYKQHPNLGDYIYKIRA